MNEVKTHWLFRDVFEDAYWDITERPPYEQPVADAFLSAVSYLENPRVFPDSSINNLMSFFSGLIKSKVGPVLVTPRVDDIQLWFEGSNVKNIFNVLLPYEFAKQYNDDFLEQESQIVFFASVARDWYFGKYTGEIDSQTIDTAIFHQGLYLKTAQQQYQVPLTPDQEHVVQLLSRDYAHLRDSVPYPKVTTFPFGPDTVHNN